MTFTAVVLVATSCLPGQQTDSEILSVLADMAVQKQQFQPDRLHEMGLAGLTGVLDELLPDTAQPKGVAASAEELARLIADLGSEDFRTRQTATESLYRLGPGVEEAVRQAARSRDADVSWRATRILRRWEARKFEDKRRYVSAFAVYVAGIQDDERLKELARRTKRALDVGMPTGSRLQILRQCIWATARSGKDEYTDLLRPLLEHEDVKVAVLVVQAVGQAIPSETAEDRFPSLLLEGLRSPRDEIVSAALSYASRCGNAPNRAELEQLLLSVFDRRSEELRFQASYPLVYVYNHEPARDYLLQQARSGDRSRQYRTLGWLSSLPDRGEQPDKKLLAALVPLLSSEDRNARRMASAVLGSYRGKEVIKHLIPLLGDSYAIIVRDVGRKLLDQPDKGLLRRMLEKASRDQPNEKVRKAAKGLLEKLEPSR